MKFILFNLIAAIAFCLTNASSDRWIQLTAEKISDAIREEFSANLTRNSVNGRIYYGSRALPGQFPFMSLIDIIFNDGMVFCGATLISRDFLISAAHCTPSDRTREIDVWLGSIDSFNFPIFREATSFLNHPEWQAPGTVNLEHDINIIRINAPVSERPANLPPRWTRDIDYDGVELVTAGWGETETGDLPQFLLYTRTVGTRLIACGSGAHTSGNFICTRRLGGSGTAPGDSGGPLLTPSNTLVGVTSFGIGSFDGFVRVDRYLDWISSNTGIVIN